MKAKNNSVSYFDMQFITSSISTTLVLLLLGLVVFFVLAAHNLSVYVKENISFSVLVSDDMKESDILKLQKRLDKEAFVKQTEYISKKQALREQTEAMGTDPQEFLGYNPFTASIEIKLHSDYANSDSIAKIEKLIKKNTNIQEVLYQKDLIDAVNDNIRNISLMLLGLAVILTFISFALINNTIRLAIYSKRFLIHTMKLVGASWAFIRRPFLRRNFWIGVLAAFIADSILWGAAYWLVSYEPELVKVITPEVMVLVSGAVLVFGVLAGNGIAILVISLYYLLFGFALSRLIYASFANGVFDKYLNPHIEGAQVGQGLRPHTDEDDADDEDDEEEDEE